MKNLTKKRTANLAAKPAEGFSVDASAGVLRNVALMTAGEAIGYWFRLDGVTLKTALTAIQANAGKLRIYPSHAHSGCSHGQRNESDQIGSELNYAAFADGISIKGDSLVAATVQFYDAFRKNYEPIYDNIMELAAKTPELLGLSVEPVYHAAYVGKDGTEYSARPDAVELANDVPAMRVDNLWAAAFGALPAANPGGLFAQLTAGKFGGKRFKKFLAALAQELKADLTAAPAKPAAEEGEAHSRAPIEATPATSTAPESFSLMKIIADLTAKFGNDESRLSRALLLVSKTPADQQANLNLAAIEAQLEKADLVAVNGQVTKLTADLGAATTKIGGLEKNVVDLTAERDEWKKKFDTVNASGLGKALPLGAPSAGNGGTDDNPFLTANLTAQCALMKKDPVRAESLRQTATASKAAGAGAK